MCVKAQGGSPNRIWFEGFRKRFCTVRVGTRGDQLKERKTARTAGRCPECQAASGFAATGFEPDNRYQAVQALWFSAADGLDPDGEILASLEQARQDPDDRIADLAEKALADLKALEERKAVAAENADAN